MKKTIRLKWLFYIILAFVGIAIFFLADLIQPSAAAPAGEYHYSTFFMNNYTILSNVALVILALTIGYVTDLNPLVSGLCLFLVFPITAIIEATIFSGSHNLIPFEFLMYFIMALPTVVAAYIGRFARNRW